MNWEESLTNLVICHTHEGVMSHTYTNWYESLTNWVIASSLYVCDMTPSCVKRELLLCMPWRIHTRDETHLYVWYNSFIIYLQCSYARRDSFIGLTWRIHMCGVAYSYVWRDSFVCVTWPIHMRDSARSYVWHDSFMCATHTWLIHVCDAHVRRDSLTRVTWHIHMRDMTHPYVWHNSFICVTWLLDMWHVICDWSNTHASNLWERTNVWISALWVRSHGNKSCRMGMSHITHMSESCQIWKSHANNHESQATRCRRSTTYDYIPSRS